MKILGCLVFVLLSVFITQLSAADLLAEDSTVKHHERKVLLQLSDIGLYQRKFTFPVTYCPFKAKKCHLRGTWTYIIDQSLEDAASAVLLKRLSGKRYDTLKIMNNKIAIKTIFESIELDSTIENFLYDVGSSKDFNEKVIAYLNRSVAPLMLRLLDKAKDARYQEMADKEKETFLATIAKEESVPVKFIEKLMTSAYVFTLHMDSLRGSASVDQKEKKDSKGNKYKVYDTSVSVNTNVNLTIFNFDPSDNKFKLYSTVKGKSGSVSSSANFKRFPRLGMTGNLFNNAVKRASKASGLAANTNLKDDDNFAIFATVDSLDGNRISSRIGDIEDLRIDAPFNLFQQIDGKKILVGWAKARSVASEKTYKEDNGNYSSNFDLISGDAEIQDSMREHPWTGIFFYIGVANSTISLEEFDGQSASGGGNFTGINLGSKLDLGYAFNSSSFSETWLELNLNLAVGGEDLVTKTEGTFESPATGSFSLDIVNRKHLGSSSIYWGYKYGIAFTGMLASQSTGVIDRNLTIAGLGANLGMQAGYQSSPNRTYYINLDALIPFGAQGTIKEGDIERKEIDASFSTVAINLTVGATFHLRSVGGLAGAIK